MTSENQKAVRGYQQRWTVTRSLFATVLCVAALIAPTQLVKPAEAQIAVNESWRTLKTRHFLIHFTTSTESVGRRAAAAAERAYANLARELVPPRGPIDVVITDAADISNGAAGVFPRTYVVIDARPPVDQTSLENYDDWLTLVLQHEVTHIFHLDRSRGLWRFGQYIFGRNPVLFPAYYEPSWLTEGLAVYYESRFTNAGRLDASYGDAVAHSTAIERELPRLDELSLATSRYPYGQMSYVYGAFLVDRLARDGGNGSVREFVETSSGQLLPFFLDHAAKRAFHTTFTHEWSAWRDSVDALTAPLRTVDSTTRHVVSGGGRYLIHPRWLGDTSVLYVADNGRESPGVYTTTLDGHERRLARRRSLDVNAVSTGRIVFAEAEFVDRLHAYSDLYVTTRAGTHQLTHGARLSAPDVRTDGAIVAVKTFPGTTSLARVSSDGRQIQLITSTSPDTQWAAPRWSPRGDRIAAVRRSIGITELVVLDTLGQVLARGAVARAVTRSPAWRDDGAGVYFTSDRAGTSSVYYAAVPAELSAASPATLAVNAAADAPTGLFYVDAARGDSTHLVSTILRSDGFHVVTLSARSGPAVTTVDTGLTRHTPAPGTPPPALRADSGQLTSYSPWRTLVPAYWSPVLSTGSSFGTLVGGLTTGEDVIGRHSYSAQALVNTSNRHVDASVSYSYSRLLNPVFSFSADQSWSYVDLIDNSDAVVGTLERQDRVYAIDATFERPRTFTYSSFTVGAELETRDYDTDPMPLLSSLVPFYSRQHRYPTALVSASFANTQRPTLSISPEDGISLSASARERWTDDGGSPSASVTAIGSAYKSLDLPGFAHHVLALRLAGGLADTHSANEYSVGGINGGSLAVIPGVTIGDAARTFPVRGFSPSTLTGLRAATASLEYRAPLSLPSRGARLLPVFLDKTSIAFFADAGVASCPRSLLTADSAGNPVSASPSCDLSAFDSHAIMSAGAELNLDTALQYDVPYRFRAGFAIPTVGRSRNGARSTSIYVTLGTSF